MTNTYLIIAAIVNLIMLIIFFVALFRLVRYTRETAENTSKIRIFIAEMRTIFYQKEENNLFVKIGAEYFKSIYEFLLQSEAKKERINKFLKEDGDENENQNV